MAIETLKILTLADLHYNPTYKNNSKADIEGSECKIET
jgi:hypothetical protein